MRYKIIFQKEVKIEQIKVEQMAGHQPQNGGNMVKKINNKMKCIFFELSVICYRNQLVTVKGDAATFHGQIPGDDSGCIYTFNAFDEVKERVLRLKLREGSRLVITGFEKNYIGTDNQMKRSIIVSEIDYCQADGDGNAKKIARNLLETGKLSVKEIADVTMLSEDTVKALGTGSANRQTEAPTDISHPTAKAGAMTQKTVQAIPSETDEIDLNEFIRAFGA